MAYYGKFKVDTDSAEVFLKDNEKIYNKKIISTLKAYRKNKAYEHLGLDGKGVRKSEAIIQNWILRDGKRLKGTERDEKENADFLKEILLNCNLE